jgi:23S rRNA (adenine2503-C2)-methyltransferase
VGIPKKLERFLQESDCHVAISLHSPLHEQRAELMPAEKAMPVKEVIALLAKQDFTHQRRISFEYIMFGGLNDSLQHAQAIVDLLQPLENAIGGKWDSQLRVNLIRFHQIPDVDLPGADEKRMEKFCDYLNKHGITTTIRASRGQDIYAACGLLTTEKRKGIRL